MGQYGSLDYYGLMTNGYEDERRMMLTKRALKTADSS
jgi:hypothetical protein